MRNDRVVSKGENKSSASKHKQKDESAKTEDSTSQPFDEWDTKRTEQWLSSLGLYDSIPEEYVQNVDLNVMLSKKL